MSYLARPIGETTVHVIGKCPVKGCKNRKRHTRPGRIHRDRLRTWTEWKIPAAQPLGEVNPYTYVNVRKLPSQFPVDCLYERVYLQAMHDVGWVCVEHDRFFVLTPVKGVINTDKTCNSPCTNAVGGDCECSCGGHQHGAAHS